MIVGSFAWSGGEDSVRKKVWWEDDEKWDKA